VDIRVVQAIFNMRPGLAAILAAEDPIDFDPDPDGVVIGGVDHDTGDKRGPDAACRGNVHGAWLPLSPAVAGAINPSGSRSRKKDIRIDRVNGE
jgi:hypothetical protein